MKWFIKFFLLTFMVVMQAEASHRALDILVTSSRCFTPKLHFHSPFRTPVLFSISPTLLNQSSSGLLVSSRVRLSKQSIDIVNPCSDFGFKRAFRDPQVAMGFLNTILSLSGEDAIKQIKYLDKELPSLVPEGKDFRVDVLCQASKGEWFLLEMQNDYRTDYPDKALIEFCRLMGNVDAYHQELCSNPSAHESKELVSSVALTEDHPKMEHDFWMSVPKVITLVITNREFQKNRKKAMFPDQTLMEPSIINTYTFRHTEKTERRLGNIDARIVLVMLANFRKSVADLETDMDKWLFALKDESLKSGFKRKGKMEVYKHVNSLEAVEGSDPSLRRFYQLLNRNGIGGDQLRKYEESVSAVNRALATRYEEGRKEGLLQAARVMQELGTMTDAEIASKLGLEEADVSAIKVVEPAL
jgi:hypothetical protein